MENNSWTSDVSDFMKHKYGLDLESELINALKKEILEEENRNRIRENCDSIVRKKYPRFKR